MNCYGQFSGVPGYSGQAMCDSGVCKLSACGTGYKVSSDGLSCECATEYGFVSGSNGTCVCPSGSTSNGLKCCENIANAVVNNDSSTVCQYRCNTGYCNPGGGNITTGTCILNDTYIACGSSCLNCYNDLGGVEGFAGNVTCDNGVCKMTSCAYGYTLSSDGRSCIKQ